MRATALLVGVWATASLGCLEGRYRCDSSAQCVFQTQTGTCESSTHFCSFPDGACTSGRRYGGFADPPLGGTCVDGSGGTGGGCIAEIGAGSAHTCARKRDGTLWCWGANAFGQVGNGSTAGVQTIPMPVLDGPGGAPFVADALSVGGFHNCAHKADGSVWCWGHNSSGFLGDGTMTDRATPVLVVSAVGGSGFQGFVAVSPGTNQTCGRRSDGTLWCWGFNGSGQLGNGTTTTSAVPTPVLARAGASFAADLVASGGGFNCALQGGAVWCWGEGTDGQIGNGETAARSFPVKVVGVGGVGFLAGVTSIATGAKHACALGSQGSGSVVCWGSGTMGSLGDGRSVSSPSPLVVLASAAGPPFQDAVEVTAGTDTTCARKSDATVTCWGGGTVGQLGNGATTNQPLPVTVVSSPGGSALASVAQISAGGDHVCALTSDGTIRCWGNNDSGQLGDGTLTPSAVPVRAMLACP